MLNFFICGWLVGRASCGSRSGTMPRTRTRRRRSCASSPQQSLSGNQLVFHGSWSLREVLFCRFQSNTLVYRYLESSSTVDTPVTCACFSFHFQYSQRVFAQSFDSFRLGDLLSTLTYRYQACFSDVRSQLVVYPTFTGTHGRGGVGAPSRYTCTIVVFLSSIFQYPTWVFAQRFVSSNTVC